MKKLEQWKDTLSSHSRTAASFACCEAFLLCHSLSRPQKCKHRREFKFNLLDGLAVEVSTSLILQEKDQSAQWVTLKAWIAYLFICKREVTSSHFASSSPSFCTTTHARHSPNRITDLWFTPIHSLYSGKTFLQQSQVQGN